MERKSWIKIIISVCRSTQWLKGLLKRISTFSSFTSSLESVPKSSMVNPDAPLSVVMKLLTIHVCSGNPSVNDVDPRCIEEVPCSHKFSTAISFVYQFRSFFILLFTHVHGEVNRKFTVFSITIDYRKVQQSTFHSIGNSIQLKKTLIFFFTAYTRTTRVTSQRPIKQIFAVSNNKKYKTIRGIISQSIKHCSDL